MTSSFPQTVGCPKCGRPIDPASRICSHCGVNVALATAFAELDFTRQQAEEAQAVIAPPSLEGLVPRLGEALVEKGLISPEELETALAYQEQQRAQGNPIRLGSALVELGLLDRAALDRAIMEQVLQYQQALQRANQELEARVRERTEALSRALKKLSELNELKSNFIANISHELRTPMTHIKGYTELLAGEMLGPLTDEQQQALETIRKAANRLESLIEDLIRYSLITRGELSLHMSPVQPAHLIQAVYTQLRAKAADQGVHLEQSVSPNLPDIRGDAEKLIWALYHLGDNAIKFTPRGGHVRLSAEQDGQLVIFAVTDTGIGIPPDRLSEVFEPFHQLDNSPTRRYGGAGLGLALVKRIIQAHGAAIHVRSREGQGSRFSFALPVLSSQEAS